MEQVLITKVLDTKNMAQNMEQIWRKTPKCGTNLIFSFIFIKTYLSLQKTLYIFYSYQLPLSPFLSLLLITHSPS